MAQITNCLKLISRINEGDQDSLISRIDELQALGVPAQRAQVQAAIDVLARLQREAGGIQRTIKRERALETNVPMEMPADPVFMAAVENTPGARVDDEGLHMRLVRWQKPEQEAGRAIRTGVFYLPEGSGNARHYRSAPGGDDGQSYGGSVKMDGDTLIRRPLFVRGATGGKAPEAAYAALHGKEAMKKLDSDVFGVLNERAWMTRQGADVYQERVENLLRDYGADPQLAADIIYHSRQGNQLRYALQENIIAHAVRAAGYDAVVGYSKGKSGPFISEVFDVREQTFPSNIIESEVHQDFSSDITRSASRLPAGVEIVEVEDGFDAMKDGKRIGRLRDNLPRGAAEQLDENASVDIVKVENEFKGRGVGAALYDAFHEKHGGRIAPSGKTSPEAWALWKRKFPQKVQEFVQAEAQRIRGGADPMMVVRNITDPEVARLVSAAVGDMVIRSARRQTETPEFKRWFGDSKVVDADGKPLVVYHGTNQAITAFDPARIGLRDPGFFGSGFYFTPDEVVAQDYASGEFDPPGPRPEVQEVIPVYLSLQNPFVWDMSDEGAQATRAALAAAGIRRESVRGNSASLGNAKEREIFNRSVREQGYDGVVVRDEDGIQEVVAFRPEQIKSATGNNGQFDPSNADITKSAKRNNLGLYSALERGIEGMQTKQAPAGAWKAQIKGLVNKGIVKQDEITWSGVEDWLDLQDGKVSKEAISEYLNSKAGKLEVLGRYADGESSGSIAKSIGIGETTVLRWVKSAGISRNASEARGVTKEKISEAVRLYGQGLSIAEVAKSVELGTSTIHRALVAAGVNRSLASVRDADARVREEALRLYASGMNTYEAAASVGVSQGTVASWAVAAGISRGYSGAQALRVAIGRHKTGRGIKAAFKSNKSGGELYAASLYELGRMHQLEADDGVASFSRSTDRIPYGDGRVYVPDLEVVSSEGNVFVEEIKPHIQLGDTDVLEKARAAEDFYKDKGKTYRLISEYAIGSDGFDRIDPDSFAQEDRDRVRSSLATIRWTLRQVADAEGEGEIALSRKRGWQGFPDSIVDTNLGAQSKDPSYEAAKAGDMKAALELVSRVMSSDAEEKVRSMIGDSKPIVVSVHAEESAGRNKIPLATAIELGDRLGLEVDTKIVQSTRAKRTGADGMARIGVQPEFTGDVVRGADYLIVDDTLTQGGTIAQLKTHIEEGGGRVVGAFALSGKQYSAKISLDAQTLSQLREQYGSIEPWWRSELGYGFDGLTQSEARFILKSGLSPDQVRDRVAAARQAAGIGAGAQDQARLSAKRDVTETPEFKAWFGDSKAREPMTSSKQKFADMPPQVMYHTTRNADFTEFEANRPTINSTTFGDDETSRAAIFFTPSVADSNAYGELSDGRTVNGAATMPVYLRASEPLYLTDGIDEEDAQRLMDAGLSSRFVYNALGHWSMFDGAEGRDLVETFKRAGYDSVVFNDQNPNTGDSFEAWAVFDPRQIKSAIGNNGQFDPSNPDITKSLPRIPGLNAGPVERTTGDYGREYTPQQLRMFKNVGRTTSKPALIDRLKEARKDLGKKMAQGIVDQFRPIRELGGNAYTLARLSKGSAGAFEALLGHGKLKIVDGAYDADTTGGFLDLVGKPLGKELEDFMFWVASNRAEALSLQDREHLFTQEDIDAGKSLADGDLEFDYLLANGATTRDRRAAYEDALKKFNEFNKNVLDIAEQSGLVDGESRQFWEGEFYVPFYRVSEEDGEFVGAKIKGGLARQRAFHELKGGSQKLNSDLLANTMRNWAHLIDASAKNRAAKATLEAAQAVGIALESDAETVRQLGKSMGGKGGTVWFMDGGQQRHFLIGDPYLLEAINSLEYAGLRGPLMDALSTMKHWLTVGVTASPAFKVRNLIRDSIQAISLSGLSYNPVKNLVEGYKATDRASQDYVSALASGGLIRFGTMLEGNAAERVRRLVQKGVPASTILNTPGKVKDFYGKFVEPAIEAYQELGNRGEEINRASLYKQLRAQGINHAEASLMARDLMDFSMQGTWTSIRFLTQVVPFLNARLQGLYKLGRGAAEDPKRFAMVAGATAMVSIALLGAYGDDDDWKKREDWDRDGFWWFKFGGTAFRIPKPFEVGAIATLAERGVELFTNDEFTAKRFGSRVMHLLGDNLAMNPIPQAVKPMLDIYANKDSFSGRPIESMGMERLQSEYRYNVNTSMIARGASSALNAVTRTVGADSLSPVQIDSLIRGYFGWLGTFVVAGADMAIRPLTSEPARPQADYLKVVTQGFLRTLPEPGSKYVSAMYDQAKILEQAFATHRQMLKEGKLDEAREFAAENKDLLDRYRLIEAVKKTQSNVNRRIREIEISDMDPARKRDEIQKLRDQADRSARAVY